VRLGFFGINLYGCATDPAAAVRVARAAEAAGWESVWTGEHYVLPDPPGPDSPGSARMPVLDPFVALTNIAAGTRTLRLGTGVTVLPWHHPLALAKRVASLDRVCGGRFLFGIGVGYLEPEFRALGVPLRGRGERTMEYLDAIEAIWSDNPSYQGRYVSFAQVRAEPRPIQRPTPPLHFGGQVTNSYRRAVTRGRGWYGMGLDLPGTEQALADLRRIAAEHLRPPELGPLEVSVTPHPRVPLDPRTVDEFARLGVTRLVVLPPRTARDDPGALVEFVTELGGDRSG
jgi:probable F420-dependent oxidoreductase